MYINQNSSFVIKVIIIHLAACCILSMYYSCLLLRSDSGVSLNQGRSVRHVNLAQDYIQVMIVSRENRIGGAIATINSIVKNTNHPVHFYIATDNRSIHQIQTWIEETNLKDISYEMKSFNPEWLNSRVKIKDGTTASSLVVYSKLFITKLFPNIKGRLVCLDDDIIVQGDICELANTTISKNNFGAFSSNCDSLSSQFNQQGNRYENFINVRNPILATLDIKGRSCTFNLGAFVLNMTLWNKENVSSQLENWMTSNVKHNIFQENGPLPPMLIALYNRTSFLSHKWHVRHLGTTAGTKYSSNYIKKAKLLHWDGQHKPWSSHKASNADIWYKYYIPDPSGRFRPLKRLTQSPHAVSKNG